MNDFITQSREAAAQGDDFSAYRLAMWGAEANPENPDIWYSLGCSLHTFKKYSAAVAALKRAATLRPGHHETLTNLGLNLGLVGRYAEARIALLRAIKADPDKCQGHLHLANILHTLGEPSSIDHARVAVALEPDSILAHMVLSFCLMTRGEWAEGFREYEWRFQHKLPEFLSYPYPIWRGEETGTLIIVSEQGFGDNIQMMRYVPEAAKRAERVFWCCQKEMVSLAAAFVAENCGRPKSAPVEIVPMPTPGPAGDVFIPTMSLPVALGVEAIEPIAPYVRAPRVMELGNHTRVGIAWAGSPGHDNARYRDSSLADFLPLIEMSGVDFYSLQIGPAQTQIDEIGAHGLLKDLSGGITNLMDTAREIARLDLVITVDTAVAHLAGAMGKECWMLVNQRARDWRWGRRGDRSDWYPSIRIIPRLIGEGTWALAVYQAAHLLKELIG